MPDPSTSPVLLRPAPVPQGSVAPKWHTALLVGLMLAVAGTGALLTRSGAPLPTRPDSATLVAVVYAPIVVVQWTLVLYVCRVGLPRNILVTLLGEPPRTPGRVATLCALALAGWVVVHALDFAWVRLAGGEGGPAALLPRTTPERLAWVVVAVSAGFGEEVVYRGYLRRQLSAFTRSPALGVILQAALFGIAHGEQGSAVAARVAVYGLLFGGLAWWRGGLWPGILCHVGIDLTSGFFHA